MNVKSKHYHFENGIATQISTRKRALPDFSSVALPHKPRELRESCGGLQPAVDGNKREATCICVEYKPEGYYRLFCAHDRALWCKCNMCRRDEKEAAVYFDKLRKNELF